MLGGKFFVCLTVIFFLSYSLVIFQDSVGQLPQTASPQPPAIKTPPFIIARATGSSWTQVNFQVSADSTTSDNIPVYCSPASGSAFPMGKTIVLCAAAETQTDLVSYAIFNVTVKDTLPPEFKVPYDILKEADDIQGTRVNYNANASDTIDGNTIPICNPPTGSIFPLGTNYVTCTSTDKAGNLAESSFSVIIKATKGNISNAETGISRILQNITNQQKPSEVKVSDNITNLPQPASTVIDNMDNITNLPQPASTVIKNDTRPSAPNLSDDILNMFKILIEDLK